MNLLRAFLLTVMGISTGAVGPIPYAPAPNDAYFPSLWYLEGLATNTTRYAFDINARSAWSLSRGAGVTIAIVDIGVDLTHPELTNQANAALHFNFANETPNGHAVLEFANHGTPVAGLAVAEGNNNRGVIGAAPEAEFASWIIYRTNGAFVTNTQLAKMFEYRINEVEVQNHSWVKAGNRLVAMTAAESLAISNAVYNGRGGLGVILIRAAGNSRQLQRNVNEDAYTSDPRAITVSGITAEGRVASYSTPGAAILVAAPGGESSGRTLMTTDRVGSLGYNGITFPDSDLEDYVFSSLGFSGTSAAAPLVSGIAALTLSANTNLTFRDVQQILLLSGYQPDVGDPDLKTNAAGLWVSHNTGFGVVNAGTAVDMARSWQRVPAQTIVSNTVLRTNAIPDAGLRVLTSGTNVPAELESIIALPSLGPFADDNTRMLPLVYVGLATNALATNLTGKAALIQRGGSGSSFAIKIQNAADAGAEFVIVFNDRGTNSLDILGGTEFVPIPAVMISQRDGERLVGIATNSTVEAQIALESTDYEFNVTNSVVTEHVLVHLDMFHELRGDVRVTLIAPSGTRSVLQKLGTDTLGFDGKWTYMSTHHFYEPSAGTWRLEVSDMVNEAVGFVRGATLEIRGMPIVDTDRDALDDEWERSHFGNLANAATDDPDLDGYTNIREWIQGLDPELNDSVLDVIVSKWNDDYVRLNWPARNGVTYEVLGSSDLGGTFQPLAFVTGGFPRVAWFAPLNTGLRFFRVREVAN